MNQKSSKYESLLMCSECAAIFAIKNSLTSIVVSMPKLFKYSKNLALVINPDGSTTFKVYFKF